MPLAQSGGNNVGSSQIIDNEIINADIDDNAGIVLTKINFGTGITSSQINEAILKTAEITLSSAEILALHTTPKELVAAPGEGKIIILDKLIISFSAGGTPYANGDNTGAYYNSDTVLLSGNAIASTFFNSATNLIYFRGGLASIITAGINKAIEFKTNTGTAFINGNGTAKIFITYRVITL